MGFFSTSLTTVLVIVMNGIMKLSPAISDGAHAHPFKFLRTADMLLSVIGVGVRTASGDPPCGS